jgi:cytosine/adenosine deaminase-related metal-dependent hydrolase
MADKVFTARWVFPVSGPPLERGVMLVTDDRIVAVAKHGQLTPDVDFGNAAIVPGFVNAHTHLDLTGARALMPPTPDFTAWLRSVIAYRKTRTPEQVDADIQVGIAECLRYGTTCAGDISASGQSWDALCDAQLRSIVFHELIGVSDERAAVAWERFDWWRKSSTPTDCCRLGVSPHAPYSVSTTLYAWAATAGLPLAIHVAESRDELNLLGDHCGALVTLMKELGAWFPDKLMESPESIMGLKYDAHSSMNHPYVFVHCNFLHCNYLSPTTTNLPIETLAFCPRTHAAFGHPPHPFREFLARGVRVAFGTDSLASNPDLSVLAEARFIASRYPDFDRATLLRMATLSGAEALGWSDVAGSLEPGKSADFAVVALPDRDDTDPHELLFHSDLPVQQTWFRGERVFERT